jgi:hypothetical protein
MFAAIYNEVTTKVLYSIDIRCYVCLTMLLSLFDKYRTAASIVFCSRRRLTCNFSFEDWRIRAHSARDEEKHETVKRGFGFLRAGVFIFGQAPMEITQMTNRDIKDGIRIRRQIYLPPSIAARVDSLVRRGVAASNVIAVSLRQALPGIEKKIESGKHIHGLRVKRGQ